MTTQGSRSVLMQQVLERLSRGDEAAAGNLIEIAYERLAIVTRKLLGSFPGVRLEEETMGVVNEAYSRLRRAIEEVRPNTVRDFMALATKKIRECLFDRIRQIKGRGETPRPGVVPLGTPGEGGIDPPAPASRKSDAADALLIAIEALPDDEREVVELIFFHGYTQAEAGEILDVHEDTVKKRWARARIKLVGYLAAAGITK